jgi:hypothetical protein
MTKEDHETFEREMMKRKRRGENGDRRMNKTKFAFVNLLNIEGK